MLTARRGIVICEEAAPSTCTCFGRAADGKTLFANVYSAGMVFAIWTDRWGTIN